MSTHQAPLGTRIVGSIRHDTHDWESMTDDQLIAAAEQTNRIGSSRVARIITGRPDHRARTTETTIELTGRRLTLRVHRPKHADRPLPLIVSFHGGGFIGGTAAQNDWLNSHLAAHCPAVVVAVEYRLAPRHPLPRPVEDGYDTLVRLVADAADWGVDPDAVAVLGESAGGMIAALIALRARADGPRLRAQVLNYPSTDWTESATDYPSITEHADNPTLSVSRLRAARTHSLPPTLDPRRVSPLKFDDLTGLPPTLVVTAGLDPVADHGRRYVDRLRAAGTDARLRDYPRATHSFLSTPGLVPAARPARREILDFLRNRLTDHRGRFVRLDDGDLHVIEDGEPDAPALLLLSNAATPADLWDPIVPLLARAHRVIRLDLLGPGRATGPAAHYDVPTHARQIAAALDILDVRRVTVIGHSSGCTLATALAEHRPDTVTGLALISMGPTPAAKIPEHPLARLLTTRIPGRLLWRLRTPDTIRNAARTAFTRPVEIPDALVTHMLALTHPALVSALRAPVAYLAQRSLPARLTTLAPPTAVDGLTAVDRPTDLDRPTAVDRPTTLARPVLVIFGSDDRRWRSASVAAYRVVPGVRVELLPGVGHTPMVEDPQTTAALLLDFLTAAHPRQPDSLGLRGIDG